MIGRWLAVPALAGWMLAAMPMPAGAQTRRVELDPGLVAAIGDQGPYLEAVPRPSEGLLAYTDRLCGDRDRAGEVEAANGGQRILLAGVRYNVPFGCLRPELQRRVLAALFPADQPVTGGWRHQVATAPDGSVPDLWTISKWFTGAGENYRQLRELNGLSDERLTSGQSLVVPAALLLAPFQTRALEVINVAADDLSYGRDGRGEYASYRLKAGEALYSSVVVRFTGRLFAVDVNPLAEDIARRSGIRDVTDIPVGYEVKIPLDVLSPEFLPADNPRRREYEEGLSQSARYMNQVRAQGLRGVMVILDAGHGGQDVGASTRGVWESVYVYDIMLRVRRILEQSTAAEVVATTRDGDHYRIEDRDVLTHSQGHAVLTQPPYPIEVGRVGTNLRWYLANYLAEDGRSKDTDPDRIVFVSIHADSLHPSVRGAMVYVPGLLPTPSRYGHDEAVYTSRREVKAHPTVTFSHRERVRSEGLSRDLAGHIVEGLKRRGLAIHANKPVRDRIIRGGGRPWVPAVLRYNTVPAKVLLEVCNLANDADRTLIQTRDFRERMAQAIVDGLLSYYDYDPESVKVAASSD